MFIKLNCLSKNWLNLSFRLNQNLRHFHSIQRTASQSNYLILNTQNEPQIQSTRSFKPFKSNLEINLHKYQRSLFINQNRFNSTDAVSKSVKQSVESLKSMESDVIDLSDFQIPHLPTPEEIQAMKAAVTIVDLGLTPWLPPGLLFQLFEYIHKSGFQWPITIIVSTIIVRTLLLPILISSRRQSVEMNNFMRIFKKYQEDVENAQLKGNIMEMNKLAIKYSDTFQTDEAKKFMSKGKFGFIKMPLIQAFVFISFFMTLRKMAYYPVPSLYESSFLWLPSLAEKDPYFLLPIITSTTLFFTLRMGIETGTIGSGTNKIQKAMIYVLPIFSLAFTYNFPSALCLYWCTANFHSLLFANILKLPKVKNYLKIPDIQAEEQTQPKFKLSSIVNIKETFSEFKKQNKKRKMKDKFRNMDSQDHDNFSKAGQGAIVKTYKYDPTKYKR